MSQQPLRFGILGAAKIARAFIAGIAPSDRVVAAAVASRAPDKAEAFARETGVPRWHGSYDALLADPAIDAVYIPLPNSLHAEWAIKAAQAGKPVLCEKPLAIGESDAKAMFEAGRRHGVPIVEAYPYMAQQQTMKLRELVADRAVGRITAIRASFGVAVADASNIRLSPSLGGGALLDAGTYPFSLIRIVAGERPVRVQATARFAANGVDLTTAANIVFPGGILAQMTCSFETAYWRHAEIAGTEGVIETNYLNHPPLYGPPLLRLRQGTAFDAPFVDIPVPEGNGFRREAESFADMLARGPESWTGASEAESLDIAATLEAIAASARADGAWISLPPRA